MTEVRGMITTHATLIQTFRRSTPIELSTCNLMFISLLIFFGLFVDILSVTIINLIDTPKHPVNFIMTIMEEGGEMIVISFLFSTFIGYFLEQRKT